MVFWKHNEFRAHDEFLRIHDLSSVSPISTQAMNVCTLTHLNKINYSTYSTWDMIKKWSVKVRLGDSIFSLTSRGKIYSFECKCMLFLKRKFTEFIFGWGRRNIDFRCVASNSYVTRKIDFCNANERLTCTRLLPVSLIRSKSCGSNTKRVGRWRQPGS